MACGGRTRLAQWLRMSMLRHCCHMHITSMSVWIAVGRCSCSKKSHNCSRGPCGSATIDQGRKRFHLASMLRPAHLKTCRHPHKSGPIIIAGSSGRRQCSLGAAAPSWLCLLMIAQLALSLVNRVLYIAYNASKYPGPPHLADAQVRPSCRDQLQLVSVHDGHQLLAHVLGALQGTSLQQGVRGNKVMKA